MDIPKIAIFILFFALVALIFEVFFFRRRRNSNPQSTENLPQFPQPSFFRKKNMIIISIVLLVLILPLSLYAVSQQVRVQKEAQVVEQVTSSSAVGCDQIDILRNNILVAQGSTLSVNDTISFVGYCYTSVGSLAKLRFMVTSPLGKTTTVEYLAFTASAKNNENKNYFQATYPHVKLLESGSYTMQSFAYSDTTRLSKDSFTKTFVVSAASVSTVSTPTPTSVPTPTLTQLPQTGSENAVPTCTSLSAIPLTGPAPLTVSFTGSGRDSDGKVSAFEFTFGDGAKQTVNKTPVASSSASTSHAYQLSGNYTASLRVQDNSANFSTPSALCLVQIAVATGGASVSANLKAQPTKTISPTPTPVTLPEAGIGLPMVGLVTGGLFLLTLGLLLAF